jgi:uncharacterized membrane protein
MTVPGPPGPPGAERPSGFAAAQHTHHPRRLPNPWIEWIRRAEETADREVAATARGVQSAHLPAWLRPTHGEPRWPVTLAVLVAIALQVLLPDRETLPLHWLLPTLEGALLVGLIAANPVRIGSRSRFVQPASLLLVILITVANAASAILLVRVILESKGGSGNATGLLATGAAIWLTNVIAFGLWYWEFDRGGPVERARATSPYPDLMFPQMSSPSLAAPDWEPRFPDYLYLAFTNATAFSPTDVMPMARWAKMTMTVQSAVSLVLAALVIARAVNILK